MKKRSVLLLEVLTAIGLFSLLMSCLLTVYFRLAIGAKEIACFRESLQRDLQLIERLEQLLTKIQPVKESERAFFYTEKSVPGQTRSDSLVFTFDNGLDPSPYFSSIQLGRLWVNSDKQLCLTYWPELHPFRSEQYRSEVLCDGVERLEYLFYTPPQTLQPNEDVAIDHPPVGTTASWLPQYKTLPALFTLTLVFSDRPALELPLYFPQAEYPLLFPEGVRR